jgi:hypothetical protein
MGPSSHRAVEGGGSKQRETKRLVCTCCEGHILVLEILVTPVLYYKSLNSWKSYVTVTPIDTF